MISVASVRSWLRDLWKSDHPPLTRVERVMHWLAIAGCVFFAATAFWECLGPPRSGHISTSAAYAIAGENMVRWKKFAVYYVYQAHPPTPDQYYCHHPYGITVLEAIAYVLFGHSWFTTRAGAIFCSVISPPLIYAFGRRAWGVIPASVATLFFSFVPIALAFNTFSNLEEPVIAFGLLFGWATVRVWETSKTRYLVLSAIGALGAANGDWAGIVFLLPVVAFGFFRAYVLPRQWYGRIDDRTYARWFAFATAMAVGTVILYLALFGKADKLGDIMGSYHQRSSGSDIPVDEVFSPRRKLWIAEMLTPVSYGAIALGIPLAMVRLVRKPLEIFPIAWFIAASVQYFGFKQGADIHIFWPHYYAPTAALAAGTLIATLLDGREALIRAARRVTDNSVVTALARNATAVFIGSLIAMSLALLARMGIPALVQSRKTGGQFDQEGQLKGSDGDLAEIARWGGSNVPPTDTTTLVLEKFDYRYNSEYGGNRPYARTNNLTASKPEDPQRIALVDTRFQPVKELERIAREFGVQAEGPFWRVDRAERGPSFVAFRYEEREPNPLEWMFVSGTDLVHKISHEEDPFRTWELRDALGLPSPVPNATPTTVDELRIAHNIAVHEGDSARAAELSAKLARLVGKPPAIQFSSGVRLQGVDVHDGPAIVVTLFWETDASFKRADAIFHLKCKILAPPPLWKAPIDYFEKEMATMPVIHPGSWKPGYLYTHRFIAIHRVGREECRGSFSEEYRPVAGDPNPVFMTFD